MADKSLEISLKIDGEKKVFKSLEQVSKEIDKVDKKSQVEVEVKGEGIEETFKGLEQSKKGLDGLSKGTKSAGKSFKTFDNILKGSGIIGLATIIIEIVQELGILDSLFSALKPALEPLAQVIQDVFGELGLALKPIIQALVKGLMPAFKALTPILTALVPIFEVVGELILVISDTLGQAANSVSNFTEKLGPLGPALELALNPLGAVTGLLEDAFGSESQSKVEAYNKKQRELTLEIQRQEEAAETLRGVRERLILQSEDENKSIGERSDLLQRSLKIGKQEREAREASARAAVTQLQNEIALYGSTTEKQEELAEAEKNLATIRSDNNIQNEEDLQRIIGLNQTIIDDENTSAEAKKEQIKDNNIILKQKLEETLATKQQTFETYELIKAEAERLGLDPTNAQKAKYTELAEEIKSLTNDIDNFGEMQQKQFDKVDTKQYEQNLEAADKATQDRIFKIEEEIAAEQNKLALLEMSAQEQNKNTIEQIEAQEAVLSKRLEILDLEEKKAVEAARASGQNVETVQESFRIKRLQAEQANSKVIEGLITKESKLREKADKDAQKEQEELQKQKDAALQTLLQFEKDYQKVLEEGIEVDNSFNGRIKQAEEFYQEEVRLAQEAETKKLEELKKLRVSKEQFETAKLQITKETDAKEVQALQEKNQTIDQIETEAAQVRAEKQQAILAEVANSTAALFEFAGQLLQNQIDQAQQSLDSISSQLDEQTQKTEEAANRAKNASGEQKKAALSALNAERKTQAKLEKQKMKAEKELAKQKRKQAIADKANAISQAAIQTAIGVIGAFAPPEGGPIKGSVLAGIIGALGAVQIATIAAQPIPQFAEGGFTGKGSKYEPAGIVHRGEYVVPKEIVESPKFSSTISKLETARTKGYADGGLVDSTLQKIENNPAVVDVRDIIDQSDKVNSVKARASF